MRKGRFITVLFLLFLLMTACSSIAAPNQESADSHTDLNSSENSKIEETDIEEAGTEEIDDAEADTGKAKSQKVEDVKMKLEIGEHTFWVILEENSSVEALKELLADGAMTLYMTDYAGMEKTAELETMLPQNNVQMNTQAGDIILYQGKTFVIYYDTNSWSLTPIGKIENADTEKIRKVLGTGDVTVTVSLE